MRSLAVKSATNPVNILFSGPSGSGATTWAELFIKACHCPSRAQPEIVCACPQCQEFELQRDNSELQLDGVLDLTARPTVDQGLLLPIRDALMYGARHRIILIRAAHHLSEDTLSELHRYFKRPPSVTFVLVTDKPDSLVGHIRSHFEHVDIAHPAPADRQHVLQRIVGQEGIKIELDAIATIATHAAPGFTAAIRDLESVTLRGMLALEDLRAWYRLDREKPALEYVRRVLSKRPLRDQLTVLRDWAESAEIRWLAIEAMLGEVFLHAIDRAEQPSLSDNLSAIREEFFLACSPHADLARMAIDEFLAAAMGHWRLPSRPTATALIERAVSFDKTINGQRPAEPGRGRKRKADHSVAKTEATKQPVNKIRNKASSSQREHQCAPSHYLSYEQCRSHAESASFMVQEHRVFFNTLICLRFSALGIDEPMEATRAATRIMQELRQRTDRGRGQLHWLSVNERQAEGLITRIAAHIPDDASDTEKWLRTSYYPRRHPGRSSVDSLTFNRRELATHEARRHRHFNIVRMLLRGVDPSLPQDVYSGNALLRQDKLVKLLGVAETWRGKIGAVGAAHRISGSRHLSAKAIRASAEEGLPMLSPFDPRAIQHFASGFEWHEWETRQRIRQAHARKLAEIQQQNPGASRLEVARREAAIAAWKKSLPRDPYRLEREWPIWPTAL